MKKSKLTGAVLFALFGVSALHAETKITAPVTGKGTPKYVFVFVGDGMSYPQFQAASDYLGALADDDYKNALPSVKYDDRTGSVLDGPIALNFMNFPVAGSAVTFDSCSFAPDSASTATSIQFGLNSAAETTRERLAQGNSFDTSFYNGIVHGVISALVEEWNVGEVTNVVNLLTGAGGSFLGVGLLSMPQLTKMAYDIVQSGSGEAFEEFAEAIADYFADNITNALVGDKVCHAS